MRGRVIIMTLCNVVYSSIVYVRAHYRTVCMSAALVFYTHVTLLVYCKAFKNHIRMFIFFSLSIPAISIFF